MGCTASKETIESKRIDKLQLSAQQAKSKMVNLLLIGSGDSGKTTLRKQIINVQNDTFQSIDYRRTFIPTIADNLVDGTLAVLDCLDRADYHDALQVLKSYSSNNSSLGGINPTIAETINRLNDDAAFAKAMQSKHTEMHLQECYVVFVERLKQFPVWGGPEWVPTADDCIRARTRTSGVVKETCVLNGIDFCIIDVGGQRAERRKWLHVFEDVTAAIFVAALSDYDQNLFEDSSKNRLEEALDLFAECINSQWLFNTPTLLFLNKLDIFTRKFQEEKIPLNVSGRFPSAPSNATMDEALEWLSNEFLRRKSKQRRPQSFQNKPNTSAETYVHFTTATDAQNVKKVFLKGADIILRENLKKAGFVGM